MIEFTDDDFVSARRGLLGDESASSASATEESGSVG